MSHVIDAIGFVAAGLVLATGCMRSMRTPRWVAIAGNLALITYGHLGNLAPVLLPINVWRLARLQECAPLQAALRVRSRHQSPGT